MFKLIQHLRQRTHVYCYIKDSVRLSYRTSYPHILAYKRMLQQEQKQSHVAACILSLLDLAGPCNLITPGDSVSEALYNAGVVDCTSFIWKSGLHRHGKLWRRGVKNVCRSHKSSLNATSRVLLSAWPPRATLFAYCLHTPLSVNTLLLGSRKNCEQNRIVSHLR